MIDYLLAVLTRHALIKKIQTLSEIVQDRNEQIKELKSSVKQLTSALGKLEARYFREKE